MRPNEQLQYSEIFVRLKPVPKEDREDKEGEDKEETEAPQEGQQHGLLSTKDNQILITFDTE